MYNLLCTGKTHKRVFFYLVLAQLSTINLTTYQAGFDLMNNIKPQLQIC